MNLGPTNTTTQYFSLSCFSVVPLLSHRSTPTLISWPPFQILLFSSPHITQRKEKESQLSVLLHLKLLPLFSDQFYENKSFFRRYNELIWGETFFRAPIIFTSLDPFYIRVDLGSLPTGSNSFMGFGGSWVASAPSKPRPIPRLTIRR